MKSSFKALLVLGVLGMVIPAMAGFPFWAGRPSRSNPHDKYANNFQTPMPTATFTATCPLSTVAGIGVSGTTLATGPALSTPIDYPYYLEMGNSELYFTEGFSTVIKKINTLGNLTIVAGTGVAGYTGDGGLAVNAKLLNTSDLSFDQGKLYLTDATRIRCIDSAGNITTVAGGGASNADGIPALQASIAPKGIYALNGILYIADRGGDRVVKIESGILTTIAGTGASTGALGDGGLATAAVVYSPQDVVVLNSEVYIACANGSIRKIDTNGYITTIGGAGTKGLDADGGPATLAHFNATGLSAYNGSLYFEDSSNGTAVRKINSAGIITTVAGGGSSSFVEGIDAKNLSKGGGNNSAAVCSQGIFFSGPIGRIVKMSCW